MNFKKILIIIIAIVLCAILILASMFIINPKVLRASERIYESNKVDANLDGFTIVFFSDLHYGTSIKTAELNKLKETINSFDPDVVIFGGDLIDDYLEYNFSDEELNTFITSLKDIEANYGKYAVYGNHDLGTASTKEAITNIYNNADFEILQNSSVKVYVNGTYLNIVGIASLILDSPDINKAYSNVDSSHFTISICHTPDVFDEIPLASTDLMLAGHSHGMQIYLPFISDFYRPNGAKNYIKGSYIKDNTELYVTNGVGTTQISARLFSDSEIVVYKLKASAS